MLTPGARGGLVLMFKVFSGVLQGCPLSGALFDVGIGPLLWCFSRTIVRPGLGKVFACADDIGAALTSLRALIPCAKLFNMFRIFWPHPQTKQVCHDFDLCFLFRAKHLRRENLA